MASFLDLRAMPTGGFVADEVQVLDAGHRIVPPEVFARDVQGHDLVLATHGFNVSGEHGMQALGGWEGLCGLPNPCTYVGVLWPGDSRFLPIIDYPLEGSVALDSGRLLARFLDRYATGAATLSFSSHSLGARVLLETVRHLGRNVRTAVLMAGAIEADCFTREYADAAAKIGRILVLASEADLVLQFAFPIGNLFGELVMQGHPYTSRALGRDGPETTIGLAAECRSWQIPTGWKFGHGDYLPGSVLDLPFPFPPPQAVPGPHDVPPRPTPGWKSSWSASALRTQIG
jgi:pimeloyl-ACP methyl ester carboxylesterase